MDLVFHGGKCCGIKTIYGFDPDYLEHKDNDDYWLSPRMKKDDLNHDAYGNTVASNVSFFTDAAPRENILDRFDRLIAFCIRRRPSGIIEAVLAEGKYNTDQVKAWGPILEETGFRLVTSGLNSNSKNTCHIYHLVVEDGEIKK